MGLRILEELKKNKNSHTETIFIPYLIVGSDFSSLLMLDFLLEKFGHDQVKFLINHDLTSNEWDLPGPSLLRGKENSELISLLFPEMKLIEIDSESKFFKDQNFRSFEGRMKPAKLLSGEDFFISKRIDFDSSSMLSIEKMNKLKSNNDCYHLGEIISLTYLDSHEQEADKGIEQNQKLAKVWKVTCADEKSYECTHLFFGQGLKKFYQLLTNKSIFNQKFHDFFAKVNDQYSLIIKFQASREISTETGTLFIPHSQTHDLGHMIGEFRPYRPEVNEQSFSFMTFVSEQELNTDELAKKIRAMKKIIGKIFPLFLKAQINESILLTDKIPHTFELDEKKFEEISSQIKNLHFLGMQSPIEKGFLQKLGLEDRRNQISHLSRSLASFMQSKEKLIIQ